MVKITDLIDDFKMNQHIQGRKEKYMELITYRLNRWIAFIDTEYGITEIEGVKPIHIKEYVK